MLISLHKDKGRIQARLTGDVMDKLRGLSGRKWVDRDCVFDLSASNIKYLQQTFPEAQWAKELHPRLDALARREEADRSRVVLKTTPDLSYPEDFAFRMVPFQHQRKAFHLSRDLPAFALFMDVATGKTKVCLDTAAYLWQQGLIDMVVVLAPNGVHRQWIAACEEHLPLWCKWAGAAYQSGMGKRATAQWNEAVNAQGKLKVLGVNIELMSTDKGFEVVSRVMAGWRVLVVVDESHKIKTPSSKRTWNVWKLGKLADYRRIATGTEAEEGYHHLYAQFRFLDPDIIGCQTYSEFKTRYCIEVGDFHEIVGYRNVEQLKRRIEPYLFRARIEDCVDLPEQVYVKHSVPLSAEQQRIHKELVTQLASCVKDGQFVTTELPIVLYTRLRQVVSGFVKTDEGEVIELPSKRPQELLEKLEELHGRTLVFCNFHEEVDILKKALGKAGVSHACYYGPMSATQREREKQRFIQDPKCRVLLLTVDTGGTGLDGLQVAQNTIFYSHPWSRETRVQTEGRMRRPGQTERMTYLDFYAPGSVEVRVLRQQKQKQDLTVQLRDPAFLEDWIRELQAPEVLVEQEVI